MKITQTFRPVTVVLESQLELDALHELTGNISGSLTPARRFTDALYDALDPMVDGDRSPHFETSTLAVIE